MGAEVDAAGGGAAGLDAGAFEGVAGQAGLLAGRAVDRAPGGGPALPGGGRGVEGVGESAIGAGPADAAGGGEIAGGPEDGVHAGGPGAGAGDQSVFAVAAVPGGVRGFAQPLSDAVAGAAGADAAPGDGLDDGPGGGGVRVRECVLFQPGVHAPGRAAAAGFPAESWSVEKTNFRRN